MHVITKSALVRFWTKHPDAEGPLQTWFRTMKKGVFADFTSLRAIFASADYVDDLTVFNIGGNKYRLIADIRYDRQKIYILHVLTHAEYNRNNWKRRN
ncbi:MAG TPA: type II toxin-antitoxin system HigB family toxin [Ktedonobacteraceae bacterium]|jgi:mRNA interferase HigB